MADQELSIRKMYGQASEDSSRFEDGWNRPRPQASSISPNANSAIEKTGKVVDSPRRFKDE